MARHARPDERQADLFGAPPPRPAAPKTQRPRKPSVAEPATEPETATAFAERAGPADLDELVAALPDDALAHLALASARQLRRRLARVTGGRQKAMSTGRGRSVLDRASAQLGAEWAAPPEEAW